MDVLLNELSLTGQFLSIQEFINISLIEFIKILKEMKENNTILLLKRSDFYNCKIISNITFYEFLTQKVLRDEITRIKGLLHALMQEPFWDNNEMRSDAENYFFKDVQINDSSLAEACKRDNIVISFRHNDFADSPIEIKKDDSLIKIVNLFKYGLLIEELKTRNYINFENYILQKFKYSKLNFSLLDNKHGFTLIEKSDENEFFDSFQLFNEMDWQDILTNDAFDYKSYKDDRAFGHISKKVYKFRITQKYRCFGYRDGDVFYVIRFETDHKLSDKG